jgi:nicotinate-nucleotide--dimethylbenzimidazole phosphoribosyltransferase
MTVSSLLTAIEPLDEVSQARARARLNDLTKPLGSLGRLEAIIVQLAGIQRKVVPALSAPHVLLFAADHGVANQGVSRYGSEVTEEMAVNIVMGGAVSSVLARHQGLPLTLVDVGLSREARHPAVVVRKVRAGTADFTEGPAMTPSECRAAFDIGAEEALSLIAAGADSLVLGEMGIGNTTATAALASVLLGLDPERTAGPGTGLTQAERAHKAERVREALRCNRPDPQDPWDVMHKVGGLEIAALAGAVVAAAARRVPVILDGVITTVAALWACRLHPLVARYCLATHRSAEPVHGALLDAMGLEPLVDWQLGLGEASGGLLLLPVLRAAATVMAETMTFADARVTNPHGPSPAMFPPTIPPARPPVVVDFTDDEREAVYKVIRVRRDIRSFLPDPVPDSVLGRVLDAGHRGPSVGLMQPWNFIVIRDRAVRATLQAMVEHERLRAAANYRDLRRAHYLRLKVEGLLDAPVTLCVTNDPTRGGAVLGRNTIPETALMSTACAIENIWLAARAEGLGVGWVSFYEKAEVGRLLGIPEPVEPVALLCIGYTAHFPDRPLLERVGWETRRPLATVVYEDRWGRPLHVATP